MRSAAALSARAARAGTASRALRSRAAELRLVDRATKISSSASTSTSRWLVAARCNSSAASSAIASSDTDGSPTGSASEPANLALRFGSNIVPEAAAVAAATPVVLALDTEYSCLTDTFGSSQAHFSSSNCRPASLGWALFDAAGELLPGYPVHKLVKPLPGFEVSAPATAFHGISHDMATADGEDILAVLLALARDSGLAAAHADGIVMGHFVEGDVALLFNELERLLQAPELVAPGSADELALMSLARVLSEKARDTKKVSAVLNKTVLGKSSKWMKLGDMFAALQTHPVAGAAVKAGADAQQVLGAAHNAAADATMSGHTVFGLRALGLELDTLRVVPSFAAKLDAFFLTSHPHALAGGGASTSASTSTSASANASANVSTSAGASAGASGNPQDAGTGLGSSQSSSGGGAEPDPDPELRRARLSGVVRMSPKARSDVSLFEAQGARKHEDGMSWSALYFEQEAQLVASRGEQTFERGGAEEHFWMRHFREVEVLVPLGSGEMFRDMGGFWVGGDAFLTFGVDGETQRWHACGSRSAAPLSKVPAEWFSGYRRLYVRQPRYDAGLNSRLKQEFGAEFDFTHKVWFVRLSQTERVAAAAAAAGVEAGVEAAEVAFDDFVSTRKGLPMRQVVRELGKVAGVELYIGDLEDLDAKRQALLSEFPDEEDF